MVMRIKSVTVDEYLEIIALPENENRWLQLVAGVIEEMPPSSSLNSMIAVAISSHLYAFASEKNLGYVTGADGGFVLGKHEVLIPDVGYISRERSSGIPTKIFAVAPDLAVEVISPGESSRDVLDKARRYLLAGTKMVWAFYPEAQVADVIRLSAEKELIIQTLHITDTLDGGDVLPDFSLPLTKVFPQTEK